MPDQSLFAILNPGAVIPAMVILVATVVSMRFLGRGVQRLSDGSVRHRLLIKQLWTLFVFVAYVVALVAALGSVFNFSQETLLAVSGTLAVAVGFALKDVATSFIASLTILINKPFQVGDRIRFGDDYGEVKDIGLRSVRLVTLDDNLVTIPSSRFLTDGVASANAGALDCMVVTKLYISPRADHARARDLLREAVLASKYLYLGKPVVVLLDTQLANRHVVVELTAKAYVYDTRHEKAFQTDVVDRALRAFRDEGIEIPAT